MGYDFMFAFNRKEPLKLYCCPLEINNPIMT